MELDDFFAAWQTLDRRLEQQHFDHQQWFRDSRIARARSGLRALARGQIGQLIAGATLMFWFAPFWVEHRDVAHLFVYGVLLHAYGLMFVLFAARDLYLIGRVDYAAPVLEIQKQLAALRAWRLRSGLMFAISGCFVWTPFMLVIFYWLGADVWVLNPGVVGWFVASSFVALGLTWGLVRWARQPGRIRIAKYLDDSAAGMSLSRAQAELEEIARFERA